MEPQGVLRAQLSIGFRYTCHFRLRMGLTWRKVDPNTMDFSFRIYPVLSKFLGKQAPPPTFSSSSLPSPTSSLSISCWFGVLSAQTGLELLPLPPECWSYRHASPYPDELFSGIAQFAFTSSGSSIILMPQWYQEVHLALHFLYFEINLAECLYERHNSFLLSFLPSSLAPSLFLPFSLILSILPSFYLSFSSH